MKKIFTITLCVLGLAAMGFGLRPDETHSKHIGFVDGTCTTFSGWQEESHSDFFTAEEVGIVLCRKGKVLNGTFTISDHYGYELEHRIIQGVVASAFDTNYSQDKMRIVFYDKKNPTEDFYYDLVYHVEDYTLEGEFTHGQLLAEEQVELLIDFEDDVSLATIELLEDNLDPIVWWENLNIKQNSIMFNKTKITTLRIPASSYNEIKNKLNGLDFIETVENNTIFMIDNHNMISPPYFSDKYSKDNYFPNDPLYNEHQWHLKGIGMENAWQHSTGKGVIVAVIDTGVSDGKGKYSRVPDLADTEFVSGYNFVKNNDDTSDGNSHGTHVAGTILQDTNNRYGTAGVAYDAKLMPIKVLSDGGFGNIADIIEGIRFAADNGAHVINLSLGGGGHSKAMEKAVKYAHSKNVFLACAAGNNSRDRIEYPAAYEGCNAVSAVGKSGNLAYYSSHGKGANGSALFIAAPGGDQKADGLEGGVWQNTIARDDPNKHGFFPYQGTSMATPHVAGVAALVIEVLGVDSYDVGDVENIIAETASKKGDQYKYGHGLLNAEGAVLEAKESCNDVSFLTMFLLMISSIGAAVLIRSLNN